MLQQYDDYKKHNRARYFSKRDKHLYEVGLIEVVKKNRTQRSLALTVGKLERALIAQCNPRDNRMYTSKESSKKNEWFDEGDFWTPPLESAPF